MWDGGQPGGGGCDPAAAQPGQQPPGSGSKSPFNGLREVIQEFRPETMCLEEVYSHAEYPRTSVLMGHARGVICLAARLALLPVVSFTAKRIKQSVTGNGNASKIQVQRAVQSFFALDDVPHPNGRCRRLSCRALLRRFTTCKRLACGGAPPGRRSPQA